MTKQYFLSLISIMYIAFGFGSLPEAPPTEGGMFIIGFYDHKPKVDRMVTENGIFLFAIEM